MLDPPTSTRGDYVNEWMKQKDQHRNLPEAFLLDLEALLIANVLIRSVDASDSTDK